MTTRDGLATMTTYSGKTFDFLEPDPSSILIEDIAHGLSMECRFQNQSRVHYSVAQHSVIVSQMVAGDDLKKMALLHDAAEAYVGDVCKPLKRILSDYEAIERRVQQAILKKFNLPLVMPKEVKEAEIKLLALEGVSFMSPDWRDALVDPDPSAKIIEAWSQSKSKVVFLSYFQGLFKP